MQLTRSVGVGTCCRYIRMPSRRWGMAGRPGTGGTYVLDDYAFGSPGEAITAGQTPEPASLGLLAIGGVGVLAMCRARKRQGRSAAS